MMQRAPAGTFPLTGIGMVTSVGLGAYPACAALRAGMSRFRELHEFQELAGRPAWMPHLVGSPLDGLTDGYSGLGRWTRLAVSALRDLLANAGLEPRQLEQAGLFVGLPSSGWLASSPDHWPRLALRVAQWLGAPGLHSRTHFYPAGHASSLQALHEAQASLRSGQFTQVIVGGIDSFLEWERLAPLLSTRRLKTDENPVGLIPGEAAAFFLMESPLQARRRRAQQLAWITAPGLAHELVSPDSGLPCHGIGLGQAISLTLEGLEDRGARTGLIVCDLNGESFRAEEFSKMVPRTLHHLRLSWRLWHPADGIGDTGAAAAALSICLGARAFVRGYAKTEGILVCASSDEGLKGAAYLYTAATEAAWAQTSESTS